MTVQHSPKITPYTKPPKTPPPTKPREPIEDHSGFRPIEELEKADRYGIPLLVRVEMVHGGIHRPRTVGYRIVTYESTMAYNQYFRGLKDGDVVTHWMPLPMMEQDKGEHLY